MPAKITREDPMRLVHAKNPEKVLISVFMYESEDDFARLPQNVRIGLAVPKMVSPEEWNEKAKVYRAEQIDLERVLKLQWEIDD